MKTRVNEVLSAAYLGNTKVCRHLNSLIATCLLAVGIVAAVNNAHAQQTAPTPKDLIGLEIKGPFYPWGWEQIGSSGFGSSPYILTTLKLSNKKIYAMLLKRQINKPKKGERIHSIVTDAIRVDNPTSYHRFARLCYLPDDEPNKLKSTIFADVGFAKYCDMKTIIVKRAWKVNLETGKFDALSTKGLVCEFGLVSVGEPDFREGCPTYNWR